MDIARYLLSLKHYPVNVALMDDDGRTALHAACKRSDALFVKLLIEFTQGSNAIISGANSNTSNHSNSHGNQNSTARSTNTQVVTPQLDLNLKCNKSGWTAFHYAASQGDITTVHLLMEAGIHFLHHILS